MYIEFIYIAIGIIGLWISAEIIIRAFQIIAHRLGISETFLGLTILSIGTSLPEIATHTIASIDILKGGDKVILSNLAVSTNVGSNIVQITAILGIVALAMKIRSDKEFLKKDYIVMLASIVALWVIGLNGTIGRGEGFLMAGAYLFYLWTLGSKEKLVEKVVHNFTKTHVYFYTAMIPVGIFSLLFCSDFILDNAVILTHQLNLVGTLIGALIIGVGTAMPELATAVTALFRKSAGMSIGVLVGSNITNPMLALGIGAMISTYSVGKTLLAFDIPFWFLVSVIGLYFFRRKMHIEKKEAIALIVFYLIYVFIKLKFLI